MILSQLPRHGGSVGRKVQVQAGTHLVCAKVAALLVVIPCAGRAQPGTSVFFLGGERYPRMLQPTPDRAKKKKPPNAPTRACITRNRSNVSPHNGGRVLFYGITPIRLITSSQGAIRHVDRTICPSTTGTSCGARPSFKSASAVDHGRMLQYRFTTMSISAHDYAEKAEGSACICVCERLGCAEAAQL